MNGRQDKSRLSGLFLRSRVRWAVLTAVLSLLSNLSPGELRGPRPLDRLAAPVLRPVELADEVTAELREDVDGRNEWFTFQRTYPLGFIPPGARRQAWEQRIGIEHETLATPSASGTWTSVGPSPTTSAFMNTWGLTSGRVNAVAVSPADSQTVLAGSSTGGIWRSSNGGASFVPVSDDQVDLAVGSLAFSKSNPSIVYAGMGDTKLGYLGTGVLKSTDAGRSWTRISNSTLPTVGTIAKIEVDPINANRVYVAQYSQLSGNVVVSSGFYLSTDGGVNWTRTVTGLPRDIAIDPANRQVVYAAMARVDQANPPQPAGLYRSADAGNTWSNVYAAPYDENRTRDVRVAVTPASSQIIYVYTGGTIGGIFDGRVVVSTDGGATWTNRGATGVDLAQFGYNTYIFADPVTPNTVYIGSRDVWKSTDGGVSWTNLTRNFNDVNYTPGIATTHPDQHAFAFSPNNPNAIYVGNDGGVSRSTNGGATFQSLNATLSLTQFVGIALHPTNRGISYGGTQDNGTQRRLDGGRWSEFIAGDGGRVVINPLSPSTVLTTYIRGAIFRFQDDGRFFETQVAWNSTFGEPDPGGRIAFYPPFTGNGMDSTLYFGTWRLFTSTDVGNSWSPPGGELDLTRGINSNGRDVLTAIGVTSINPNVIYTGSAQGRAMVSTDGGRTWRDATSGLPNRSITGITVDSSDSARAYVTVSGFLAGHVFRTTDTGATWTDVSSNLPDIPANALLIDPVSPNTLYVGTDIGVFRSATDGGTWQSFNRGLPPVVIHAFAAQRDGLIQLASYGRGVYEIDVGGDRPSIASATWNGKKALTISGSRFSSTPNVTINGTDRSGYILSATDDQIKLRGKAKKLGLVTGDNTIQVLDPSGAGSNVFVIRL
ncbi:MAG TPA: hypothetical protein VJH03_24215 [Blastocatellia bacterium]|nr:hypothetical protein [Blastocatellia bacterium]